MKSHAKARAKPVLPTPRGWWPLMLVAGSLSLLFALGVGMTVARGIGTWGSNVPVAWATDIANFVWWIGIAHAGTFICASLLLTRHAWRTSINRLAETMAIIAIAIAALFPILHLGRPWFAYWLLPYPSTLDIWPNYKSALTWDVASITAYFVDSLLFGFLGLIPDFATARDRATDIRKRRAYGVLALGWRGRDVEWRHHRTAYLLLAALGTPLVISVSSIVSLDFSITQLPGWHATIFPPFFVVAALYSGFAMLLTLLVPVRRAYALQDVITERHLSNLATLMLVTGSLLAYGALCEIFGVLYGGDSIERHALLTGRMRGPYAILFWAMTAVTLLTPHLFWWKRMRTNALALFVCGTLVWIGMWLERYITIVASLSRDFLPSSWDTFAPSWVEWSLIIGSVGVFLLVYLCFLRWMPVVPVSELKRLRFDMERGNPAGTAT